MGSRSSKTWAPLRISGAFVFVLFLATLAQALIPYPFDAWGIFPRTVIGLRGIIFSPLLHGSWAHFFANAIPMLIVLAILFSDRRYHPESTLAAIWIISGLGTWLIGRGGRVHIGASSIVFGLVSYLIVAGFRMRSWRAAFVALVVLFFFGGIFYGALPQSGPISWEGHLCGAVAGIWMAWRNHG